MDLEQTSQMARRALPVTGGRFVPTRTVQAWRVGRACARLLVAHCLGLATMTASPAIAQPSAVVSNVSETRATASERRRPSGVGDASLVEHELKRHHIGIQLAVLDPATDVIALGNLGLAVEGVTALTVLNYRYSLNPRIDVDFDIRYWVRRWMAPASPTIELTPSVFGPGLRLYGLTRTRGKRVIPYIQGNIYYVREDLRASERLIESGIGFGLSGGADLGIGRLISIPIEATYIGTGGDAIDDLSGFALSVGVNFNF